MSNTAESQVNIKAKLDGSFETTINTGKRKMGELGDAARAAGKGTGAIGDGMAGSAQKVEAATKNMIGSIQRQTAALEAGDKSSRKYQESLAKMRGIDVAALRPYLDQLDAMKAKQGAAAASQKSLSGGFDVLKTAVGGFLALNAAQSFVRMADSITTLQTSLKLSAGSAKEAGKAYEELFAIAQRSRVSFTELGNTYATISRAGNELGVSQARLLKVTEAIGNAMTIGGGSAAGMQAALVQLGQGLSSGTLRGEELNSILEQTPRLAKALADGMGVSVGELRKLGEAGAITGKAVIDALEKSSVQLAKEVHGATVTVGQAFTMLSNSTTKFVGDADQASGASASLASAMKDVSGAIDSVGEAIKNNQSTFSTITAGLGGAAAVAGLAAVASNIGKIRIAFLALSAAMAANPLTLALMGIGAAIGGAVAMTRAQANTLSGMKAELAKLESSDGVGMYGTKSSASAIAKRTQEINRLRAAIAELDSTGVDTSAEDARLARGTAEYKERTQALKAFNEAGGKYLSGAAKNQATLNTEIETASAAFNAGSITAEQYAKRINDVRASFDKKGSAPKIAKEISEAAKALAYYNDLIDESSGYSKTYAENQNKLALAFKTGQISYEQYATSALELVGQQPLIKEALKAEAEALKELAKFQSDYSEAQRKALSASDSELVKAQELYDAHGKLASVLMEEALARDEATLAAARMGGEDVTVLAAQVENRKKLVEILRNGEVRDASEKSAKDAADEWGKASEKIEQDITDALMRGFESGKGFAETLKDTIENTFKTMVIRPVIQGVVQGGMNAIGLGSAQGGGTINGIGGAINTANSMNSLYAAGSQFLYGSSVGASAASLAAGNMAGMVGGDALGTMIAANGSWAGVSAGTAAGTAAAGTAATGAGAASSLAAAGPYVAAAIAAYMIADSLFGSKGGPKTESSYDMSKDVSGMLGAGDASKAGVAGAYVTGLSDSWAAMQKSLGITSKVDFGAHTSVDTIGDAQTSLGVVARSGSGEMLYDRGARLGGTENVGRSEAELQAAIAEETTRVLFAALKASDLPTQYTDYLSTIGDSVSEMTVAMSNVTVVHDFNKALLALPFENLKNLGFDAAKGLIEAAGGLDTLSANLGTYYTNFYSAEEQRLQSIKTINSTVGNGFDAASTSAASFRAIVEAAMLDTSDAGLVLTAKLLSVSGAMGQLTSGAASATAALKDMLEALGNSADNAMSALERSVESEKESLQASYDAQLERYTGQLDAVTESVGKLKSLSDSLKSTLDGMRISGSDSAYRADAQAQISAALATARSGGGLPLDGQLTSALATVSKPSEQLFSTFEDYARDFYRSANDISALSDLTGVQLTAEEQTQALLRSQITALEDGFKRQIKALDDILSNAKKQLDAANGIDAGVTGLASAMANLAAAITTLASERAAQGLATAATAGANYYTANPDVAAAYNANSLGMTAEQYANVHYGLYGAEEGRTSPVATPAAGDKSYFAANPDVAAAYNANAHGMTALEFAARHFADYGIDENRKFAGFAVGTNYVPRDMTANIHEGERIIPAADNRALMDRLQNPQQNNAELVAEIRALRAEVTSLKASNEATAKATSKFASQFDTATEGGRAILTEAYTA